MKSGYFIEGNIGSGKTETLKELNKMGYNTELQDVKNWTYLPKFYENPKKYAFDFQKQVFNSYINSWNKYSFNKIPFNADKYNKFVKESIYEPKWDDLNHKENNSVLFEGFLSNYNVFAKLSHRDKLLNDEEFNDLTNLYNAKMVDIKPQFVFWLNTDPEICLERIKKRGRVCEKNIKIDYLKEIDCYYKNFFQKQEDLLIIEIDSYIYDQKEIAKYIDDQIRFFKKNKNYF